MWNVVEDLLTRYGDSLGRASNVGKYWISMFNVVRFMFLLSIADNGFGKEALECNTNTPGCERLCTNKFFPLSPKSFWQLQLIGVTLPIILFVIFSEWKIEKIKISIDKRDAAIKNDPKRKAYIKKLEERNKAMVDQEKSLINRKVELHTAVRYRNMFGAKRKELESKLEKEEDQYFSLKFQTIVDEETVNEETDKDFGAGDVATINQYYPILYFYYFCMVILRTGIEIAFNFFFYMLYFGNFFMIMPQVFQCNDEGSELQPCNGVVDCYVERPYAKTAVIVTMFGFSFFTIIMGFVELWSLGAGNTYFALKNYKRDITKLYTVGTQEQQFHSEHYDADRGGFVQFQGTRVDHIRDEIGSDDDGPRMIGI